MFLQKALSSYENRPEEIVTEPKISDSAFIIRGKDRGREAWHYILVPADKLADLKAHPSGADIDVKKFGSVIQYRNHRGKIMPMSGWGIDPPKMIDMWIEEHYGQ